MIGTRRSIVSTYVSVGGFFASRAFKASAEGSITPTNPVPYVDFESDLKVDDTPQLIF